MARPPVRQVSGPAAIQPIASPVNTYVRPADPGRSSLRDLAEGLAAFDSGLGGFLQKRRQEQEEADYQRGLMESYRQQGPGWEEGVRRGLIPPSKSPRFMEGLRTGQGNLAGIRLRSQFLKEFLQWEGRDKGDDAAFQAFFTDFVTKNVPEDSHPDFLTGIQPHLKALSEEGFSTFDRDTANAVYGEGLRTDSASLTEVIRTHEEDGQASPTGIDYEAIWANALTIRQEALKRGTLHADIDAYLVDTIILNAERTKDEGLLAILDKTLPDQEHPMSYGLEVQKKRDDAAERIANAKAKDEADTAVAREKEEERLAGQVYAEIATIWAGNIDEEIPEAVIEDLSRIDPMARSKLADLRKKMAEADGVEDSATIARIFADIHQGTATKRDIMAHFERGTIRSAETLNQALDRVDRMEKVRTEGTGILSDATLRKWHTLLEGLTGSDPTNPFGVSGLTDEGLEAVHDMNKMVLDWEARNPEASFMERQEAINRIGGIIRQRIELEGSKTTGGRYVSPEEERRATTEPDQGAIPQALPQAAPATPPQRQILEQTPQASRSVDFFPNPLEAARDLVDTLFGSGEEEAPAAPPMPPMESLPEDQRQAINDIAERHGVDPETAQRDIWAKVQELMETAPEGGDDPGIDPISTNSIPQESRDKLSALFRDPPKVTRLTQANVPVTPILRLIGHTEGTTKGDGYNETLGYGAFTGGDVNLTSMTLDEVDALQTRMLAHPNNSYNSSAVGEYQIVRKTLRSLRQELGLRGDELYDEDMQDRLAAALLERRGLSKWQAGEISDEQFLNNLAEEWASLPRADGRGHYKGQRATATPKQVLKALYAGPPGHTSANLSTLSELPEGTPTAYSKIPDVDGEGRSGQIDKFRQWNSDPVANHEANLASLNPTLGDVVTRAQELSGVRFVIGSGKRDKDLQKKAVEWGWSKTEDSDHLDGNAVDLWPLDADGAVNFDSSSQAAIVKAMKQAAKELGVTLDVGADWKSFKDKPHFAIKQGSQVASRKKGD
ncbi:M15 family metallopeptidase [Pseudomonas sp. R2.Fl]|nr:M15 family metallopeptidase [Pseudomonas sp. R2.Fl]